MLDKHFDFPRPVLFQLLILLSVICILSLPNLTNLYLSNDFRVYFSKDNPQLLAFEQFEEHFSSHDSITLVAHLPSETWLKKEYRNVIKTLTDSWWQLPYVKRVNSLSNYQFTYARGDTLISQPLFELSESSDAIRNAILQDRQLKETFLSPDESVTLVSAELLLDPMKPNSAKEIVHLAKSKIEQWQKQYPEIEFYLIGSVVSNVTLEQAVKNDLITLIPISYLVITLGLLCFLRSIKATLMTLLIISASILFTFSIYGWFKVELTPVAGFVPSIVLTLAVADCVHYLTSYRVLQEVDGIDPLSANREAFHINLTPITITSLTTALGVLFLNFSDSPPYRDLGNMVSIGVMLAWILTICMLPIMLNRFPISYNKCLGKTKNRLIGYSKWLQRHYKVTSLCILALIAISAVGLTHLTISENWSKYFSTRFELAKAIQLLEIKFNRLHRFELELSSGKENGINDVNYLKDLDMLLQYLEHHPKVRHIQSYGYILKRLNQNMHFDNADYFRMPESRELAAQYLLIYELSLPEGFGVDNFITFDRRSSRTTVMLEPMNSEQLVAFEKEILTFFNRNKSSESFQLFLSGMDHIFAHIAHRNILQMLFSSISALLIISLTMTLVLRSIKYGLVSLIPNLFPALIAYGLWGFTEGYIDLALSVVICMSIGIIVDDSVHFITKYLRYLRQQQNNSEQALNYAFDMVGKALITTTVILVGGFITLVSSPLLPTASTGALISLTLVVALLVDFTLLPIILYLLDKKPTSNAQAIKDRD
jgi:hypothetical protein